MKARVFDQASHVENAYVARSTHHRAQPRPVTLQYLLYTYYYHTLIIPYYPSYYYIIPGEGATTLEPVS
jgi:hypothetical protein